TRTIHERLVSDQYLLLKQSDHIHQTLAQIVLEGGGVQELAGALAQLVNRAVTIEDPELNLLAYAGHGEVDPARQASIEEGGTPEIIRRFVKEQGILDRLNHSLSPVIVPAFPEHGMTKERIVAPIVVERRVYGYLWLIAGDEPLNELDTMTIERAAIVAALIMLKDTAVRQTEARLQADVIAQLLSEHPYSPALEDKANRLGLDLNQAQRVLLIRPPGGALPSLKLVDRLAPAVQQFTSHSILQPLGQNLVLILPEGVNARRLSQTLIDALPDLKIGLGSTAPSPVNLAQSYQQAEEALQVGLALIDHADIFSFEELGFLHWLYHLPPQAKAGNRYAEWIETLATEERAARAQLLRTLEVFLDRGGNAAETARVLNIHRNTLVYRLKQIETYCRISLADPDTRLNLQIAVKAYRLANGNRPPPR
ncbi:MAG: PucR family transcriptional regulator, partial [Anaerolineae bacterium]